MMRKAISRAMHAHYQSQSSADLYMNARVEGLKDPTIRCSPTPPLPPPSLIHLHISCRYLMASWQQEKATKRTSNQSSQRWTSNQSSQLEKLARLEELKSVKGFSASKFISIQCQSQAQAVMVLLPPAIVTHTVRADKTQWLSVVCNTGIINKVCAPTPVQHFIASPPQPCTPWHPQSPDAHSSHLITPCRCM